MRIKILTMLVLIVFQSCWMSLEPMDDSFSNTDDFSVNTSSINRDDNNFYDFIATVNEAPADLKQALVDSFMQWADSSTGLPYLENTTAYFLYMNGSNPTVSVAGDFTAWDPVGQSFTHLSGTNLYYRGYNFEADARLDYKFVVNNDWILDPLNPHQTSGGYGPNSELAMNTYVQPPEIQYYDIPHGAITTTTFTDTTQGRTRTVQIYTPPGYAESDLEYRTVYFLDGSEYVSLGYAVNTFDYLIAESIIPPIIGIFTDPINRNEEYTYDYEFMAMFVNELVPWIDAEYQTLDIPEDRAITGVSLGGLTSLLFTISHPEVFGNCGAYSPAVWIGNLDEQYENSEVLPIKIYMDAGTYEPSIMISSAALKETLANNGWSYSWHIWHEGHSWGAWRAHLDESLKYFWPLTTTGIDSDY